MDDTMLNDRSSLLSLLETRRSGKPRELVGPGPTAKEMERILGLAARTPDHGKLAPWRFVTVAEDQRDALEAVLLDALAEENPDVAAENYAEVSFGTAIGYTVTFRYDIDGQLALSMINGATKVLTKVIDAKRPRRAPPLSVKPTANTM